MEEFFFTSDRFWVKLYFRLGCHVQMNDYQRYIRANCQELLCGWSTTEIWDGQLSGRHTHILKCRSFFKWQDETVWCKWGKQPDKKWYVFWHSNGSFCDRGWPARQWHLWTPQLHPSSLQRLYWAPSGALFQASPWYPNTPKWKRNHTINFVALTL